MQLHPSNLGRESLHQLLATRTPIALFWNGHANY